MVGVTANWQGIYQNLLRKKITMKNFLSEIAKGLLSNAEINLSFTDRKEARKTSIHFSVKLTENSKRHKVCCFKERVKCSVLKIKCCHC